MSRSRPTARCRVQCSRARRKLRLKTVVRTHLPIRLPMECEVFAGAGGGFAVPRAGVHRGEGRGDTGAGHSGIGSGAVQRRAPEIADEAGEAGGNAAECGGGADECRNGEAVNGAIGCAVPKHWRGHRRSRHRIALAVDAGQLDRLTQRTRSPAFTCACALPPCLVRLGNDGTPPREIAGSWREAHAEGRTGRAARERMQYRDNCLSARAPDQNDDSSVEGSRR